MKSAVLFSVFGNLILLVIPIYTIVIYDKILTSHSYDTLIWVTTLAIAAMLTYVFLESFKTTVTRRIAIQNEKTNLDLITNRLDILAQNNAQNLDEIYSDIKFITQYNWHYRMLGYDMPWAFVFMFIMYLLHPLLFAIVLLISLTLIGISFAIKPNKGSEFPMLVQFLLKKPSHIFNFRSKEHFKKILNESFQEDLMSRNDLSYSENLFNAISKVLKLSASIFVIATGAYLVIGQQISMGSMIAASMITGRILSPIEHIGKYLENRKKYLDTSKKIKDVILSISKYNNTEQQFQIEDNTIDFKNVKLIDPRGGVILSIEELAIPKNKIVAISGANNSGKTLMLKTISGLQKIQSGQVKINDVDINKIDKNDILFVEAAHNLFPGTLLENISGFNDSEEVKEQLQPLIEKFNIATIIKELPRGIHTALKEIPAYIFTSGFKASIKIIYSFSNHKKIRCIDDVENGLDFDKIKHFKNLALNAKKNGETIFYVCQHKSMLDIADYLIVLNNGQIVNFVDLEKERMLDE